MKKIKGCLLIISQELPGDDFIWKDTVVYLHNEKEADLICNNYKLWIKNPKFLPATFDKSKIGTKEIQLILE